jgi:hypothetical protein
VITKVAARRATGRMSAAYLASRTRKTPTMSKRLLVNNRPHDAPA